MLNQTAPAPAPLTAPVSVTLGRVPGPGPNAAGRGRGRLHVLDGLRLVAALMVVGYHYLAFGEGWPAPVDQLFPGTRSVASYGYLGVEFFFLISGFVICMSGWGRPVKEFFVSRVTRLYPAYWFAVVATSVTVAVIPGGRDHLPWNDILTNLTMLQEPLGAGSVDPVYWTLFAELRFYLLFTVLAWWGLTYRRVLLFCCVWGAASVLVSPADPGPLKLLLMPGYSWFFIAGMAFYLMYRFRPNLMLFGVVGICYCASLAPSVERAEELTFLGDRPTWPVLVVLAAFFGLMALVATGRLSGIRWRWLPVAGALTYPLYLLHEVIGWELFARFGAEVSPWVLLTAVLLGMLVLSYLVHRLVEQPLGRSLRRHLLRP
ncbi:acyltransferase family protein [Streptomyces sp. NPDC057695]|uniref:acyltransferase family protein n=1 Tax=unclassified Streptomyces TaxID=2593676 RepID=UPI003635F122